MMTPKHKNRRAVQGQAVHLNLLHFLNQFTAHSTEIKRLLAIPETRTYLIEIAITSSFLILGVMYA